MPNILLRYDGLGASTIVQLGYRKGEERIHILIAEDKIKYRVQRTMGDYGRRGPISLAESGNALPRSWHSCWVIRLGSWQVRRHPHARE